MREITSHRSNLRGSEKSLDERIRIEVTDDPDNNGVSSHYSFASHLHGSWEKFKNGGRIDFHSGPVYQNPVTPDYRDPAELPLTGVSETSILSVLIDRLRCSQRKEANKTQAKAIALTCLEEALLWLHAEEKKT